MSLFLTIGCLIAAVIWAIKGEMIFAIAFLAISAVYDCAWHIARCAVRLKDIHDLNKDKVLAEKTLSAIMAAARKAEDDGK